jgi:hypothetical protein
MSSDPYFFPFKIVKKEELIPGENYYIKLNDKIIKDFVDKRRNVPVSHVSGQFIKLHTEVDRINTVEYAIFKNVRIMNKKYKLGLCTMMLVRYPEGFLANAGGCDTYSDRNRTINEDREVYFNVNRWMFGVPTEQKLLSTKAFEKINPKLPDTLNNEVLQFHGTMKPVGGKKKTRKSRKNKHRRKTKRRH